MRVASQFVALLLAVLLVAQATSAVPECDAMLDMGAHHGMDSSHHSGRPAPSGHHLPCQAAVCATMTACVQVALAEPAQPPVPQLKHSPLRPVARTGLLPTALRPPEPPPPRA